jgi:clan AA aspartic protease
MTPMADVEVAGIRRKVAVKAVIDSGFDGHLCLPTESAVNLGLELSGRNEVELADGSRIRELVFKGVVHFPGKKRRVDVSLTDGEALIGTALLADCRVIFDFPNDSVRIYRPNLGKK